MRNFQLILLGAGLVALSAVAQQDDDGSRLWQFHTVDVIVDSQDQPLAVYQMEIVARSGARIVGVEGGAPAAFREPPHYDPKAIQGERVILGAFSTEAAENLPVGPVRVATLHVQTPSEAPPQLEVRQSTAANPEGTRINAKVSVLARQRNGL